QAGDRDGSDLGDGGELVLRQAGLALEPREDDALGARRFVIARLLVHDGAHLPRDVVEQDQKIVFEIGSHRPAPKLRRRPVTRAIPSQVLSQLNACALARPSQSRRDAAPRWRAITYMKQMNVAAPVGPWQATSSRQKNVRGSGPSWGGAQY